MCGLEQPILGTPSLARPAADAAVTRVVTRTGGRRGSCSWVLRPKLQRSSRQQGQSEVCATLLIRWLWVRAPRGPLTTARQRAAGCSARGTQRITGRAWCRMASSTERRSVRDRSARRVWRDGCIRSATPPRYRPREETARVRVNRAVALPGDGARRIGRVEMEFDDGEASFQIMSGSGRSFGVRQPASRSTGRRARREAQRVFALPAGSRGASEAPGRDPAARRHAG
jgi:hypothetical protein